MVLPSGQPEQPSGERGASMPSAHLPPQEITALRAELARAVSRICPRWMADRAEDLVQVALLRVVDALRRQDGREEKPGLSPFYLKKAAYSALVDEIRRLRRRQEVGLDEGSASERSSDAPNPERNSASREAGRAIRDCLGGLIRPRRLAVTLHLQGHSLAESAQLLGWSAKKAENLIYRGLADLRSCLESKGVGRR